MPTHWVPLPPKLVEELCCQKRWVLEASGACRYNQLDESISCLDIRQDLLSYRDGRRYRTSRRPSWQLPQFQARGYSQSFNEPGHTQSRVATACRVLVHAWLMPSRESAGSAYCSNYFGARALLRGLPLTVNRQGCEETKCLSRVPAEGLQGAVRPLIDTKRPISCSQARTFF
jgi:hypothetical protein